MIKFIFIGVGGAVGAVLRYFIDSTITQNYIMHFPLGTLTVNLIGCFFIGVAFKIFYHGIIHIKFNPFIITGFLGALTTFSSYAYTTLILIEKKFYLMAGLNILVNNIFGILFAYLGLEIADFIISKKLNVNKRGEIMILTSILVSVGGAIGAIFRYIIDKGISKKINHEISFGTLGVNLIGLFIIGFSYRIFEHHIVSKNLKHLLVIGFLGALTTFSTYALHTFQLFEKKKTKEAITSIILNNFLGMIFALLGSELGKFI